MKLRWSLDKEEAPLSPASSPEGRLNRWILVGIVVAAFAVYLWGIRKDLPFATEADEPEFVSRAVSIATTGNWDPGWFGHPGSTVIYPLAVVYRAWNAVARHGMFFRADPNLQLAYATNVSEFYIWGRFLTISYALLSVPLVYQIGRRAFGTRVGLAAAFWSAVYPLAVAYAQVVRTDSAAAFFGLLSLWLCLRLADHPSLRNHILAGAAIGLSIATRYFMVSLVFVLLAVDVLVWWRQGLFASKERAKWTTMLAGLIAVPATFALSTPYFFSDFQTVWSNLALEAEPTHLGADGLSPIGNFWWYLSQALPGALTGPQALLVLFGAALIVWRRRPRQLLLLEFVVVFLIGISLSTLHWPRWIIQILPILAMFAADALWVIVFDLASHLHLRPRAQWGLILAAILAVSSLPAYRVALYDLRQAHYSTQVVAREWMVENLPAGSQIAKEWYTAPLAGTNFAVSEESALAEDHTLDDYYGQGYRYLLASDFIYGRFMAEPGRYPRQVAFYGSLAARARLLREFRPSFTNDGPVIRVYDLRRAGGESDAGARQ